MTPLQTLGQSLDHWQALYIVAISLALISTFSMVFFAFHKDHPFALRTSNYVYVVASVLAVLSTIAVVNKTKSLDNEKDRLAKIAYGVADVKISQANAAAATANQRLPYCALSKKRALHSRKTVRTWERFIKASRSLYIPRKTCLLWLTLCS